MPRNRTDPNTSDHRRVAAEQLADAIVAVLETAAARPAAQHEHLLSPEDAAECLGVSRATLFKFIRAGALGSLLVGGRRKISLADLDEFIAAQRRGAGR